MYFFLKIGTLYKKCLLIWDGFVKTWWFEGEEGSQLRLQRCYCWKNCLFPAINNGKFKIFKCVRNPVEVDTESRSEIRFYLWKPVSQFKQVRFFAPFILYSFFIALIVRVFASASSCPVQLYRSGQARTP